MEKFEEQMAHIMRTVDDLSDIVAAQQNDIDRLKARVEILMRREASGSGGIIVGDERPPHY
jgi:SlyX protein|tara:strand:- start:208 stop:390 length:183 start_codon:yes stop_codon:yes gene_type:complete